MYKKIQKPLLYILPTESVSLQETVSSAITTVDNFDENNQVTYPNYKSEIIKRLRVSTFTAAGAFDPISTSVSIVIATAIMSLITDLKNNEKSQNKESIKEVSNVKGNNDSKTNVSKILKSLDLESWSEFIEQIPYSCIPEDFEFSPGHPLPGRFYRAHPLKSKNNKYIPIETFDQLLYAEREAELIRLLVDLGAIKITIQEKQVGKIESDATVNAALTGTGGVKSELKGDVNNLNELIRTFSLGGINWTLKLKKEFDEQAYSWLSYEPAWAAVVHSRLHGKCLTASIELTNNNSYSISGKMGLTEGLLQSLAGVDAGASFSCSQTKKSLISVEFAPPL